MARGTDSMALASESRVGASKRVVRDSSTPKEARMRETTWVTSREWPPSSKKLSWTPTRSTRSTSLQSTASFCSVSLRGATYSTLAGSAPSGEGRALRSTLPLLVSGMASRETKAEGTMKSGSRCLRKSRREAASRDGSA
ncbi:hypothetical protein COSO111634_21245 [Corallococcus soli]